MPKRADECRSGADQLRPGSPPCHEGDLTEIEGDCFCGNFHPCYFSTPMPTGGKKRKAETSTTMWTSSSSSSPGNGSSRRGSNKNKGSRPGTSSDKMTTSTTTTSTESKAEELWEGICDEDNPTTASMEGEVLYFLVVNV